MCATCVTLRSSPYDNPILSEGGKKCYRCSSYHCEQPHLILIYQLLTSMLTAPQETTEPWTSCMLMLKVHSVIALSPLDRADHSLVLCSPKYVPLVQCQPVCTRTVRRWTWDVKDMLQDCFESTDWDVLFKPHEENINTMTDCITEYIKFREHN